MRNFKHKWKIAFACAVLTGIFLFNATTHKTTQAAAPPDAQQVAVSAAVETTPIMAVGSMGGSGDLSAANKTDY